MYMCAHFTCVFMSVLFLCPSPTFLFRLNYFCFSALKGLCWNCHDAIPLCSAIKQTRLSNWTTAKILYLGTCIFPIFLTLTNPGLFFCCCCCCCLVTQSCPTLWDPMDCSTWGFPVLHYLPEFAQTHVHWVGDAIQPSHPLSPPSPRTLSLSQYQGLFQWVGSSCQVARVLEFQCQHLSFQWIFLLTIIEQVTCPYQSHCLFPDFHKHCHRYWKEMAIPVNLITFLFWRTAEKRDLIQYLRSSSKTPIVIMPIPVDPIPTFEASVWPSVTDTLVTELAAPALTSVAPEDQHPCLPSQSQALSSTICGNSHALLKLSFTRIGIS